MRALSSGRLLRPLQLRLPACIEDYELRITNCELGSEEMELRWDSVRGDVNSQCAIRNGWEGGWKCRQNDRVSTLALSNLPFEVTILHPPDSHCIA